MIIQCIDQIFFFPKASSPLYCMFLPSGGALDCQGWNGQLSFNMLKGRREFGTSWELLSFKQLVGVLIRANIDLVDLPWH